MTYHKSQDIYTKLYWLFTGLMLLTAIPLAIVLIVVKLFEVRRKRRAAVFRPVLNAPLGAQTTVRPDARSVQEQLQTASGKMRRRAGLGLVLVIVSSALLVFCRMNGINLWTAGCCLFVSSYYMFTGLHTLFAISRFRDYAAAMGSQPVMPLSGLSAKTGLKERQIRADLAQLEFMALLPNAVLDRDRNLLFCF